jgi:hypothetical protein
VSFKSRQNQQQRQQQQQHEGSRVNNFGASLEWIFYFLFFGGFVGYPRSPLMFENSPRFWSGYHRTNSLGWWWFCTVVRGMATLPRKLLRLPAPLLRSLYTLMSNSPPPVGSSTANSNCNKNANTHNKKNTHTHDLFFSSFRGAGESNSLANGSRSHKTKKNPTPVPSTIFMTQEEIHNGPRGSKLDTHGD